MLARLLLIMVSVAVLGGPSPGRAEGEPTRALQVQEAFDTRPLQIQPLGSRVVKPLFRLPEVGEPLVVKTQSLGRFLPETGPTRVVCTVRVLPVDPSVDEGILRIVDTEVDPGIFGSSVCDH